MKVGPTQLALKQVTKIALLAALCVVLRQAFSGLPNVQPITAIFLLLVSWEGIFLAFLVMSLTMLLSSFLLGFGPWVLFQIVSFGLVLLVWLLISFLVNKGLRGHDRVKVILLAFLAASMGIWYGMIIDSLYAAVFHMPWWTYVLAGMPFNLAHAISTLLFYPLLEEVFRRFSHVKIR